MSNNSVQTDMKEGAKQIEKCWSDMLEMPVSEDKGKNALSSLNKERNV